MPSRTGWSRNTASGQLHSHLPGRNASIFQFREQRGKLACSLDCLCTVGRGQSVSTIPAKANPASLGCLQSSFGALRNHLALMFGNRCEDMQG